MPRLTVISRVVSLSRLIKPWKSAANSSAPGKRPILTFVEISHAEAALTRTTFGMAAMALRAAGERVGSFVQTLGLDIDKMTELAG